jgi:cellobiose phosphorylase
MINPVNHARSPQAVSVYKTEPYVVAADVYGVSPHTGRGGWAWYTGSAGWLYRLMSETLLGLVLEGNKLHFKPCLPPDWSKFTIKYRYRETPYRIEVTQTEIEPGSESIIVDGTLQHELAIALVDDRVPHAVEIRLSHSRAQARD